jgi:ankyrin repeat protein
VSFSLLPFKRKEPPKNIVHRIATAIAESDLGRVTTLLSRWPEVVQPDSLWFGTWLHHAAKQPSIEIVEYLLSLGLDVNAHDQEGVTPLVYATEAGHYDVARFLIERGALLDTTTSIRNPLFGAISGSVHLNASWPPPTGQATEIVNLLLENGIDTTVRYDIRAGKNVDAVQFAWIMGARDLARIIALRNAGGDEAAAQAALDEAGTASTRKK